jgi:hypothetical protein
MNTDTIYIKQDRSTNTFEAYTTLRGMLRSEGLDHVYMTARSQLNKSGIFTFDKIIFSKIKLNHKTWKTKN